jgi:hypothetical protein
MEFCPDFPTSAKVIAYIEVAHYYFDQGVTPATMVSKK